jgi:hypothetical protein
MRKFLLLLAITTAAAQTRATTELQAGLLPSFLLQDGPVGLLRVDTTLLFGGDFIWFGPYAAYEGVSPQVTDTSLGAALRFGNEDYFELQGGYFHRVFEQTGTPAMNGNGFSGSLIYGLHLSPHLGLALVLSGKRISSGTLDKRWIVDLLPLFTARVEF